MENKDLKIRCIILEINIIEKLRLYQKNLADKHMTLKKANYCSLNYPLISNDKRVTILLKRR